MGVDLEASTDLKFWTVIPGTVRLADGQVQIVDPGAFAKRESYYRITYRDPARNNSLGGLIPMSEVPASIVAAAEAHLLAFVGDPATRTSEDEEWVGARLGPTARHVFDPAFEGGIVPCFFELKVVSPGGEERGYILVTQNQEDPEIVEFSTDGPTKTERALRAVPGHKPRKFMRFTRSFITMEDDAGQLLGTMGTWPAQPEEAVPTEVSEHSGEYDSETQTRVHVPPLRRMLSDPQNYSQLRSAFVANPTRVALRSLRAAAATSRRSVLSDLQTRHVMQVGEVREILTDQFLSAARVDTDEGESASLSVQLLRKGFRAQALFPGTELVRVRTSDGHIETHTFVVEGALRLASAAPQEPCPPIVTTVWTTGTGWHGDQRQYHQPHSEDWCLAVGCGPVAIAMLYGWWDTNGVPSAFYRLNTGFGEADNFRFRFNSIRHSDASKTMTEGYHTIFRPRSRQEASCELTSDRPRN